MDEDYTVSVHALDSQGRVVAQADGQPLNGRLPTSRWVPGATIADVREIVAPEGKSVSSLRVGWYLLETMERLPEVDAQGRPGDAAAIPSGPGL